MALMRIRRAAQLTLPAEVRQALDVQEGDYLDAQIVAGGVMLRPVAVVERKRAWKRIEATLAAVEDTAEPSGRSNRDEEENIAEEVTTLRRARKDA